MSNRIRNGLAQFFIDVEYTSAAKKILFHITQNFAYGCTTWWPPPDPTCDRPYTEDLSPKLCNERLRSGVSSKFWDEAHHQTSGAAKQLNFWYWNNRKICSTGYKLLRVALLREHSDELLRASCILHVQHRPPDLIGIFDRKNYKSSPSLKYLCLRHSIKCSALYQRRSHRVPSSHRGRNSALKTAVNRNSRDAVVALSGRRLLWHVDLALKSLVNRTRLQWSSVVLKLVANLLHRAWSIKLKKLEEEDRLGCRWVDFAYAWQWRTMTLVIPSRSILHMPCGAWPFFDRFVWFRPLALNPH